MMFTPLDADIGGAPACWLRGSRAVAPTYQPAGNSKLTIPFDRCTSVVVYDSRDGLLPQNDGWTPMLGAGEIAKWVLEGGNLRLDKSAGSYYGFSKSVPITVDPAKVLYFYSTMRGDDVAEGAAGEGIVFKPLVHMTPATSGTALGEAVGAEIDLRGGIPRFRQVKSAGTTEIKWGANIPTAPGWVRLGASLAPLAAYSTAYVSDDIETRVGQLGTWTAGPTWTPFSFSSEPAGAEVLADELQITFGTSPTLTYVAFFQDVVAANGRWIRARFTGYSQVSTPVLRMYLCADANGSLYKTARFKVKYGQAVGDPGAATTLTASVTASLGVANATYEIPVSLPGLVANAPFWFSIERDWEHADDKLDATVHLLHGTVRAL